MRISRCTLCVCDLAATLSSSATVVGGGGGLTCVIGSNEAKTKTDAKVNASNIGGNTCGLFALTGWKGSGGDACRLCESMLFVGRVNVWCAVCVRENF